MKIVFMGTPDFAVPSLEKLIEKYDVRAVFTQPDRPKGRGKKLAFSPVKECAVKHNISVYQPVKLKNNTQCIDAIKAIEPDFIVVVAFGQILTKEVLDIPKYGCINLHGSLLPKFRGAAPINFSIIEGEKVSGNTTMMMDVGLDTGDMLLKDEVEISDDMTAGELYDVLRFRGGDLLVKTLDGVYSGTVKRVPQDNEKATYVSKLDKNSAKINWNEDAEAIKNKIRGMNPWPVAYTDYNGETMKIYKASVVMCKGEYANGEIIRADHDGILVKTGKHGILIEIMQFPNKKPMKVRDYLNGHSIEKGLILK